MESGKSLLPFNAPTIHNRAPILQLSSLIAHNDTVIPGNEEKEAKYGCPSPSYITTQI